VILILYIAGRPGAGEKRTAAAAAAAKAITTIR